MIHDLPTLRDKTSFVSPHLLSPRIIIFKEGFLFIVDMASSDDE